MERISLPSCAQVTNFYKQSVFWPNLYNEHMLSTRRYLFFTTLRFVRNITVLICMHTRTVM